MSAPNDPAQVVDDETYEFLAEQMGITFPRPAPTDFVRARPVSAPTMVYPDAAALLSAEALGLYCKLRLARAQGSAMDIDVAASLLDGDEARAWMLLDELASVGCIIAPEYAQALEDERIALMERNRAAVKAKAKRKQRLTAPNPFPSYLGRMWSGMRDDLAATCPKPGIAVVYFLCDIRGDVLYVGSTGNVYERLDGGHRRKPWATYEAYECADRTAAYWREALELLTKLPPLNSEHDNVNGYLPVLRAMKPADRPTGAILASARVAATEGAR